MGTQEERDWVDVANDLLSKCHINLILKKVTDCDASVFVALYEAILGEKVPDYAVAPRSQEDDIHNVQSVIDSLALDYLQISLSHITGENVVRGDKESIKNLLEIFDGLLEYLTEQVSEEECPDEGEPDHVCNKLVASAEQLSRDVPVEQDERLSQASSEPSTMHSSKHSLPSWSMDGSESTAELILLGDSARTFMAKQEEMVNGGHHTDTVWSKPEVEPSQVREQGPGPAGPTHTATPLLKEPPQPSYQATLHRLDRLPCSVTQSPASVPSQRGGEEEEEEALSVSAKHQSSGPLPDSIPLNGLPSPHLSPGQSEASLFSQRRGSMEVGREQTEDSKLGPRRVLFRTQPEILPEMSDGEDGDADSRPSSSSLWECRRGRLAQLGLSEKRLGTQEELDEPLSWRTRCNRQAEQELHEMSEKLTRRLEELDLMLKRALGEPVETISTREEDKQSHHSDSFMECCRPQRQNDTTPPPVHRSTEGTLGQESQHYKSRVWQQEPQSQRRLDKVVEKACEEELKELEERAEIEKVRLQAQEAEREYREAIRKEILQTPKGARVYSPKVAQQNQAPRARHAAHSRGRAHPRKATPMKVKDNQLLPILLEELPHLRLSPHAFARMWKEQMKQVDRLTAQPDQRSRIKLANQIEEAHRKYNLLVEIMRKEQAHNQRLHDFRERIQQQKSAQNKLREQRQQVARARKYHSDYHVQLRARLMRARTREERMFKQLFEEGLELQKARLREQRAYAKEQQQEHRRRHRDQLESMENYYRDQFSLLAETLAQEKHELQVRKKAQEKALHRMRRELRLKMEQEIRELQKIIIQNNDDNFFQDLEMERLRERLRMASFQYSTGHWT